VFRTTVLTAVTRFTHTIVHYGSFTCGSLLLPRLLHLLPLHHKFAHVTFTTVTTRTPQFRFDLFTTHSFSILHAPRYRLLPATRTVALSWFFAFTLPFYNSVVVYRFCYGSNCLLFTIPFAPAVCAHAFAYAFADCGLVVRFAVCYAVLPRLFASLILRFRAVPSVFRCRARFHFAVRAPRMHRGSHGAGYTARLRTCMHGTGCTSRLPPTRVPFAPHAATAAICSLPGCWRIPLPHLRTHCNAVVTAVVTYLVIAHWLPHYVYTHAVGLRAVLPLFLTRLRSTSLCAARWFDFFFFFFLQFTVRCRTGLRFCSVWTLHTVYTRGYCLCIQVRATHVATILHVSPGPRVDPRSHYARSLHWFTDHRTPRSRLHVHAHYTTGWFALLFAFHTVDLPCIFCTRAFCAHICAHLRLCDTHHHVDGMPPPFTHVASRTVRRRVRSGYEMNVGCRLVEHILTHVYHRVWRTLFNTSGYVNPLWK